MGKGAIVAIAAVLVAMILVVSGCGSDSDTSSDAPLTRAEFQKQANEICKTGHQEAEASFEEASQGSKPGDFDDAAKEDLVTEAFVDPYSEMVEGLQDLSPPAGDEQEVEAIIAAMEKGLERLEDDPLSGLTSVSMFKEANKLNAKYGLESCIV
ncbi:MAG TPA: hypothetical protein VI039_05370 [Solirubrobacterales bacterium]